MLNSRVALLLRLLGDILGDKIPSTASLSKRQFLLRVMQDMWVSSPQGLIAALYFWRGHPGQAATGDMRCKGQSWLIG